MSVSGVRGVCVLCEVFDADCFGKSSGDWLVCVRAV